MIRDKTFYRTFFVLTLSIALQNLLTYSVSLADNLMLGAYSETALSGAALCNQIQFFLQMLVVGAGEGVVVMGTQYWGKKQLQPIAHIIGLALRFGVAMAAGMAGIAFFFPGVLGLLTNDAAVVAEGGRYLRIICFTYVIFTATNILTASLRAIGIVKLGYAISFSTLCINICLNTCLIYGKFGFPELGIRGAAIATLISRCVELGIVLWYLKFREHQLGLTLKKLLHADRALRRDYLHTSFPVLISQGQWGLAMMVQTAVLGHLGQAAIAANSIATIVGQIVSVVVYGSASASGILMGKAIGEGRNTRPQLTPLVHTLIVLYFGLGVVNLVAILAIREPVLRLYDISPQARSLAFQFMTVLAVTSLGTAMQMSADTGIIRGGGDTKFSGCMNLISMWLFVVPASCAAAYWLHAPAAAVFFLLKSDQLYKLVPVYLHLSRWKWIRVVTRDA